MNDTQPRRSFWQRGLGGLLRAQLTQGVTPDDITRALAVGTVCSVLPFFGLTSLMNLAVGALLRLNQPVMQTLNQLLTPVQMGMILAYLRLGEVIWRAPPEPFSFPQMMAQFRESPGVFFQKFGWMGIEAATAWAVTAPFLIAAVYYGLRPAIRRLGRRVAKRGDRGGPDAAG